jgi:hypothetical protein
MGESDKLNFLKICNQTLKFSRRAMSQAKNVEIA